MITRQFCRLLCLLCALAWAGTLPAVGQSTGNGAPQFGAADEVNLRVGPGDRFPIDWIYRREGLPVEVINEHDVWRQIRDHEDTVGWVHQSLLSGRRRVLIIDSLRSLRASPDPAAPAVARSLNVRQAFSPSGVIGALIGCAGAWCQIEVKKHAGWLRRDEVYGLYPDEQIR